MKAEDLKRRDVVTFDAAYTGGWWKNTYTKYIGTPMTVLDVDDDGSAYVKFNDDEDDYVSIEALRKISGLAANDIGDENVVKQYHAGDKVVVGSFVDEHDYQGDNPGFDKDAMMPHVGQIATIVEDHDDFYSVKFDDGSVFNWVAEAMKPATDVVPATKGASDEQVVQTYKVGDLVNVFRFYGNKEYKGSINPSWGLDMEDHLGEVGTIELVSSGQRYKVRFPGGFAATWIPQAMKPVATKGDDEQTVIRYGIGDKVKLFRFSSDKRYTEGNRTGFSTEMNDYAGRTAIVQRIYGEDRYVVQIGEATYTWIAQAMTLVEKGPPIPRTGDRVTMNRYSGSWWTEDQYGKRVGKPGKVILHDSDGTTKVEFDDDGRRLWVRTSELRPYTGGQPRPLWTELKTGDKVTYSAFTGGYWEGKAVALVDKEVTFQEVGSDGFSVLKDATNATFIVPTPSVRRFVPTAPAAAVEAVKAAKVKKERPVEPIEFHEEDIVVVKKHFPAFQDDEDSKYVGQPARIAVMDDNGKTCELHFLDGEDVSWPLAGIKPFKATR